MPKRPHRAASCSGFAGFAGFSLVLAVGACAPTPTPASAAPVGTQESPASDHDASSVPAAEPLADRDPALAYRLVHEEGALLLDVRSQAEFDDGHVEGATLIPHDQLADRLSEIAAAQGGDSHRPIVVYCRSGKRATAAKEILSGAGYDQVTNLGGFTDWCNDCGGSP